MKLSEQTINILKNFSTINPSLLVKPGNDLITVSPTRSIFAKCTVEEKFPKQFAIYELSKFLGMVSLFKEPDLEFMKHQLRITSDRQSVNFTYADPNTIVAPTADTVKFPSADVEFELLGEELQKLIRAASILQLPHIVVSGDGSKVKIAASDAKNPTTDTFSVEVGATDKEFNITFKVENIIKLLSTTYNVKITLKGLAQFTSDVVTYFVASEK
jgi:hypothetical protein